MTNNEKLKIIQKHFKLKAQDVADICYKTSVNTIWAWRTTPDSVRFRTMNDGEYALLVNWLVKNERIVDESELDELFQEDTN
ncbi:MULTISPECIES: hypothetical protein [Vibrio]|uniref:hypothetical protein n=1 Tax=Vibrio TaxID=662 RepID=UPI000CD33736|nr:MULTISPECIES: hypothetical protein [Vibrio]AUW07550.1 hypothetical protein C1N51_28425 [Vibrio campbellii]MDF5600770.1 hypothetical protein [Vibrio parahaemolyticus]MDW2094069.1 hypothetical protein [Vibrio sp. 1866]MDW3103746.1 hypothetical protein [Vibrio sp. 1874]MDW3201848.1 hypothetical protein [Vibrio sp. 1865]